MANAGDGLPLRKVPSPGTAGVGGSPPGGSLSNGAETTQSEGTVKGIVSETPSENGETADSPGASPNGRNEDGPPTVEESAQSNAA